MSASNRIEEDLSPQPSVLSTTLGLLLVAALVGAIYLAWHNPASVGRDALWRANLLLGEKRYSEAANLLASTLPTYSSPVARLSLSYAYLARRDAVLAERQARVALTDAPPQLLPAVWAQLGRAISFAGRDTDALDAWRNAVDAVNAAPLYSDSVSVQGQAHSAQWQIAMTYWRRGDWSAVQRSLEVLAVSGDLYALSAQAKLAQLLAPTDTVRSMQMLGRAESLQSIVDASKPAVPDLRVPGLEEGLSRDAFVRLDNSLRAAYPQAAQAQGAGAGAAVMLALWGGAYLSQGENTLAQQYLQRAVTMQPDMAGAQAQLGVALLNLGDAGGALAHLQTAVKLDPKQPLPHYILARLYIAREEWPSAAAELSTLNKLEPDSVELHLQEAEYYQAQGDYGSAEEQYIAATKAPASTQGQSDGGAAPLQANPQLTLARFYTDVRGLGCEKGLPAAQDSLTRHPDDPASLDAVGWALVLCHQPAEALPSLQKAVAASPDVPRYLYHLGKAYAALARYTEARAEYNHVSDLDPGGSWELLATSDLVKLPPDK